MTKHPANQNMSKSKPLVYLEYVLLAVCLSVIALRVTLTEGPAMQSTTQAVNLGDTLYSLSISAVLIFSFVVWVVWSFCSGRFAYRSAGIEIALGIFCIAAVIAGFAAADKRVAITDVAEFLAPIWMALLLVQILDSQPKVKLMLAVIAALGVVSAYQCAEQFFVSNQVTIEQYQENPQSILEPLGIEPGSFQQFMFEHRLYSRGVRGFFTTRNSAGSFALMAFFAAVALWIDKFKNRKSERSARWYLFGAAAVAVAILSSLVLTRSKGAIAGLIFAGALFCALLLFGKWIRTHKKALLAVCLLLAVAGGWAAASYGLKHGRLPGGGSMLVRWQYWRASAQMAADHPLTGVGPGNFSYFYTHYKPAAALESVADPHNFPLSLLTQYGPLGLAAFLAMIFIPLWKALSPAVAGAPAKPGEHEPAFRKLAAGFLLVISIALVIIRPILTPKTPTDVFAVLVYVIVTVYIAPIAVFIIAFLLAAGPLNSTRNTKHDLRNTITAAALFCAAMGVLLHNLTDFAIFEPGVFTAFWAMMACLVAINNHANPRPAIVLKPATPVRLLVVAAALVASGAYLAYVLVPVAASTAKIRQASQAISIGQFDYAHELLEKAAEEDALSDAALSLDGRLYLHQFEVTRDKNRNLLVRAEQTLKAAIDRNDAAYKNFE
ncbi:MAG: O-antigen ligase family protein, partial [Sedimentisphaerales bacterium]